MKKRIKNNVGRDFKKIRTNDKLTTSQRSLLMSKIRSRNTDFENRFIADLKKVCPVKFKTHVKAIPGNPDIVFNKDNICVFLDSNFWHGWYYPKWKHLLKDDFWRSKIERNRKRDLFVTRTLRSKGWIVIRIWEHQIKKKPEEVMAKILRSLKTKKRG